MDSVPPFFEAVFTLSKPSQTDEEWHDESTDDFYIFTSSFGTLRLRKRYSYPATFVGSVDGLLYFGYGDWQRARTIASSSLSAVAENDFGDQEFLYGEVSCRQQTVIIQRDATCVLPIFAAKYSHKLALSNHSERLHDLIDQKDKTVDNLAAVNYMLFDDRYRSLLENSGPLHDRARLEWQDGSYTIHYPVDSLIAAPSDQAGDPRHFKQALESTLDTYWERYDSIGFELSGGLDSATAPGYYADQGKQIIAVTLGLPGTMGSLQQAKIQDMMQRFKLENYTISLDHNSHFPFAHIALTGRGIAGEYNDLHLVATRQLADYLASKQVATIFTGVGGDELCQNINPESILPVGAGVQKERLQARLPRYATDTFAALYQKAQATAPQERDRPIPSIAYSVMLTNLGSNNVYIDRNIWPVAPLSDPKLFMFAQSIPAWHRYDKNLLRIYHFARSFPESITQPKTIEDFSEFIHLCKPVLHQLFEPTFSNSKMAEQGLIDTPALLSYSQEVISAPFDPSDTRILGLIRLFVLEVNLQNFHTARL